MARVALVYRINEDDKSTRGIYQKMLDQAEAWTFLGHTIACFYTKNDGLYRDEEKLRNINVCNSLVSSFWYFFQFHQSLYKDLYTQQFDLIIFRYSPLSLGLNRLASKLKKKNPDIKLVIDLPTYPFYQEYSYSKQLLLNLLSGERSRLKNHFDAALHLGHEEVVFGVPTIHVRNGVNVGNYTPKSNFDVLDQKIRLIFIGSIFKWQNLTSLLLAIDDYLADRPMIDLSLKIIGDGPEMDRLNALVASRPMLNTRVFFIPSLYGQELDAYVNESDLGIGYLGGSNRGVDSLSPLKHRHFSARGLPFIYRCVDEDFDQTSFTFKFSDEVLSKASIYQMVEWYVSFSKDYIEMSSALREFAEQNLNWEIQCEKISHQLNL